MRISKVLLTGLVLFLPLSAAASGERPIEAQVGDLMQQVGRTDVQMPEIDPAGMRAAEDLMRQYQSPAFQKKLSEESQRLTETLFRQKTRDGSFQDEKTEQSGILPPGGRIYIFVSSSIPLNTLRNYAADMERLSDSGVVMVLRGFVGGAGGIGPTANLAGEVLKTNPTCELTSGDCSLRNIPFIVDPMLFRQFGINQVPAIVFAPAENQDEGLTAYGDASLGYVLKLFAREGAGKGLSGAANRLGG